MAPRASAGSRRLVLLVPAGLALLAGMDAALMLLGLPAPVRVDRLPQVHGMLMVLGFVGTLIALERAVALGRGPAFAAPALLGAGGLLLLTPLPVAVGQLTQLAGTLAFAGLYVAIWRRQQAAPVAVQALGAVLAVGASALWLAGVAVPGLAPFLVGFLVLTIAGERLELLRVGFPPAHAEPVVVAASLALAGAVLLALLWPSVGYPVLGACLLALVTALVRYDVARRTVRAAGLPRFSALAMLAGYGWLAVAGGTWLVAGPVPDGPAYDAVLHAVFLGFVLSMVMAHAPVILPAVLRRPLPYRSAMLVPLAALHVTLALRVLVGDAHGSALAVQVGGVGNILAVLGFLALAVHGTVRGLARPGTGASTAADTAAATATGRTQVSA
ncbi:hypothetical protein [Cellulomonas soli]|uniref:Uncharacterized protein n=1 Tax=Cellulomonas soli TaxID=931535 RepID=A0A512PAW1_9CELL|nr:hypothetical protein [Cellulomonas soli]GEP68350.1 hypothetical protein CSO01_10650 [Cellulomonas soli]